MKKGFIIACCFLFFVRFNYAQQDSVFWSKDIVACQIPNSDSMVNLVSTHAVHEQCWNELEQPLFWKKIMTLSPDSCVINIGSTRQIIDYFSVEEWEAKSDEQKNAYRDSVRSILCLSTDEHVYMTRGKNDFYLFDKVIPSLSNGVNAFIEQGVDPWYAQTILLIESPGALNKSSVGAYGAFQLMPNVARLFGLKVNKYEDERKDFYKSAVASSKLIKTICIPQAERILNAVGVSYSTDELWFRLFVMHIYHAGALNVEKVVNAIRPSEGGQSLITKMWQTKAGGFGNASQNYSQIALATLMVLSEKVVYVY
jgi:hypothetical protein